MPCMFAKIGVTAAIRPISVLSPHALIRASPIDKHALPRHGKKEVERRPRRLHHLRQHPSPHDLEFGCLRRLRHIVRCSFTGQEARALAGGTLELRPFHHSLVTRPGPAADARWQDPQAVSARRLIRCSSHTRGASARRGPALNARDARYDATRKCRASPASNVAGLSTVDSKDRRTTSWALRSRGFTRTRTSRMRKKLRPRQDVHHLHLVDGLHLS